MPCRRSSIWRLEDVDLLGQVGRHPVQASRSLQSVALIPPPPRSGRRRGKYQKPADYSSFCAQAPPARRGRRRARARTIWTHIGSLTAICTWLPSSSSKARVQWGTSPSARLLGRRHRHADDARLERPEEPLGQAGRLRLPVAGVRDLLPVRLGLGEGVHHVLGVAGRQRQREHDVRAALEGEQGDRQRVGLVGASPFSSISHLRPASSRSRWPGTRSSASCGPPRALGSVSRVHGATPSTGDSAAILTHRVVWLDGRTGRHPDRGGRSRSTTRRSAGARASSRRCAPRAGACALLEPPPGPAGARRRRALGLEPRCPGATRARAAVAAALAAIGRGPGAGAADGDAAPDPARGGRRPRSPLGDEPAGPCARSPCRGAWAPGDAVRRAQEPLLRRAPPRASAAAERPAPTTRCCSTRDGRLGEAARRERLLRRRRRGRDRARRRGCCPGSRGRVVLDAAAGAAGGARRGRPGGRPARSCSPTPCAGRWPWWRWTGAPVGDGRPGRLAHDLHRVLRDALGAGGGLSAARRPARGAR